MWCIYQDRRKEFWIMRFVYCVYGRSYSKPGICSVYIYRS